MKASMATTVFTGVICLLFNQEILAQQKYALVVGVKSYQHVQPLQNSLNDAQDIAELLKSKGFGVVELYDPKTKREMQDGIMKYFAMLQAQHDAVGLVFYSGHGMQVKGVNYLIPTQADLQIEADLDDQCLSMDYVMRAIEQAGNGLNIFVLDACRNNPFRSFSRSGEKGLSMVDTPKGSYIVYATKPGSVASDGTGRNGLFTSKLLQYINTEGLNIEQVFKRTAHDVAAASNDAQRPWIASDYTGDFFFSPGNRNNDNAQLVSVPNNNINNGKSNPSTVDDGDSSFEFFTIKIGEQIWTSRNLNVSTFSNGDPIAEVKTQDDWDKAIKNKRAAWCYYNNDPANGKTYGKLYNWFAVNDPRGLAPKGWHIPSDSEWNALTNYLGGKSSAGLKLKSTNGWNQNGNGNNSSGLTGLPSGMRGSIEKVSFRGLGENGFWWSSTQESGGRAIFHSMYYLNDLVYTNNVSKGDAMSVRCIKD